MNIKELKEWLKSEADNLVLSQNTDAWIYLRVLSKISSLNESAKVIIPQFVANWIEEYKQYGFQDKLSTVYWFMENLSEDDEHFEWLDDEDNQILFLDAVANGYEVKEDAKKEKKYRFNIPTAYQGLYDTGKEVAILPYKYGGATSVMTMERAKT